DPGAPDTTTTSRSTFRVYESTRRRAGFRMTIGLRDSFTARWPESGPLILLAKGSISHHRTASKSHQPGEWAPGDDGVRIRKAMKFGARRRRDGRRAGERPMLLPVHICCHVRLV